MEEYILKFSKVRDKTLKSIEAMNKDKKEVLFSMNTSKVVITHIKSLDSFRFAIVNGKIIIDVDEVL